VLLDYGAAATEAEELAAKDAESQAKPKERGEAFDPLTAAKQTVTVDHIAVRMKAWDVVARYNDLLTALAEGKAADQLAAAVDGLSSSLGSFPIAEVALSWTQVSGYLAPLKPLALEAVREQSRRQFVAAVGKGAPLITDNFLKLLRDDAADFYRVRFGLNDREYRHLLTGVAEAGNSFADLCEQFQQTPEVSTILADLNNQVIKIPRRPGGAFAVKPVAPKVSPSSAAAPTPEAIAQLTSLQADAAARVAQALAKDAELDAYRQVLTHYVDLLDKLEQSMRGLQIAAEQAQPAIPQGADLERTVILLRQAYIRYKDIGKE